MSEPLSSKSLLSGGLLPLLILAGVLLLSGVVKKLFFSNSSSFETGIPPEGTALREPAGAALDQELYHESPPDATTSRGTRASDPLTAPRPLAGHPEMERLRLMTVQIRLLREYAALHGPDDPFSLTEKEIEDFRLKGNPYIE